MKIDMYLNAQNGWVGAKEYSEDHVIFENGSKVHVHEIKQNITNGVIEIKYSNDVQQDVNN